MAVVGVVDSDVVGVAVPDVVGVDVPVLVSVEVPDVVGVAVPVWSSSYSSSGLCVRVALAVGEPEVLVLVFDVSGCLDSEVLVLDVDDVLVFDDSEALDDVLVFDDSEALDDSAVFDRDVPLMPYFDSYFFPSATPGSATAIGIIATTAAAAVIRPARFQSTSLTPQFDQTIPCNPRANLDAHQLSDTSIMSYMCRSPDRA